MCKSLRFRVYAGVFEKPVSIIQGSGIQDLMVLGLGALRLGD